MKRLEHALLREQIISQNNFIILQQYEYQQDTFILLINLYLNEILTFPNYPYAVNYLFNTSYPDCNILYLVDIDNLYVQLNLLQ